jgi:hypothetical protein
MMTKRQHYELQDIDEVERLRQVRRDFEQQFKTLGAYFDELTKLQKQHDRRVRREKKMRTKQKPRARAVSQ